MANLVIPRRGIRTEQPTEMVGIAPYWLAKNPALLCNYGVSHLNLIDGSGSYKSAAATVGVTRHGAGRYSLATSGFNYPDMPFGGNAPISIVAFVAGYSSAGSGVVGQGTEIVLRTNAANNGCEFLLNSFATNDRVSVVATPRPGGGLLLAGTYGPSGKLRAYANSAMAEVAPTGTYANIASVFDVISTAVGTYGSNVHAVAIFRSELSQADVLNLVDNPWQLFAPRESRLFVTASSGSANATASGSFSPLSLTPQTAGASGSASASGSLAAITLSAPTATASAGGSATASGAFAALSISPATATATATKSATASGAFAVVSLSAPTATASGTTAGGANATGTPAQITISHATAIAIGSAVASGGFQSIGITAPSATASVGNGNATASGSWAAVSITAPTGYASSGFIRAPSGIGPTVIQPGSYRMRQSATSRPSNTGGRRY